MNGVCKYRMWVYDVKVKIPCKVKNYNTKWTYQCIKGGCQSLMKKFVIEKSISKLYSLSQIKNESKLESNPTINHLIIVMNKAWIQMKAYSHVLVCKRV